MGINLDLGPWSDINVECCAVQDRLSAQEAMAHPYFAPVRQRAATSGSDQQSPMS